MKLILVLPIIVPFVTAIINLFFWKQTRVQRAMSVGGSAALLGSAILLLVAIWRGGIQAVQIGSWPAPFGITLVSDLFAAIMVVMAGLTGLVVSLYSLVTMDRQRESFGYHALYHILLMGVCGSFLTGDVFNLYVWFEVMLIASFVLVELGGEKRQLEGAVKYVTLNLVSSALFLTAVGVLYGVAGSLNMADLSIRLADKPPGIVNTLAMLFFLAFGIKAAVFPLFFWLPASYHTPPAAVSAIFAGLLTKVGVYSLIRVFTLIFTKDQGAYHLILIVAGMTMLTGVLGAVAQNDFRRLLSFHIVSQIGYMIMGLGLFTTLGLAGSILHIVHNIFAKTNLFLISGAVYRLRRTYDLPSLGGLYRTFPFLSILFLISAFSLAGMPPLSGFWSKLLLIKAGLESEAYALVVVALIVSLLTLFSMTKIWNQVFWKKPPKVDAHKPLSWPLFLTPLVILAVLIMSFILAAEPLVILSTRAAHQLLSPADYIYSVLGEIP